MQVAGDRSYIGVDLGGTHLSAVVWNSSECVWQQSVHTNFSQRLTADDPAGARETVIDAISSVVEQAREKYPDCKAIGVGAAGFVDADNGRLISSPNLPGLMNIDLADELTHRLGLPVIVENDAIAAAWAEATLEESVVHDLFYIGLGTGIGGGAILNGAPWRGSHGYAMEIGHLIVEAGGRRCGCGKRGCMERYASASGVILSYAQQGGNADDAEGVARFAGDGDQHAIESFAKAGRTLAVAAAHIIKVLDVTEIVIGGGMSAAWGWLQPHFDKVIVDQLPAVFHDRLHVRMSSHGSQAGMIGAAKLASLVIESEQ